MILLSSKITFLCESNSKCFASVAVEMAVFLESRRSFRLTNAVVLQSSQVNARLIVGVKTVEGILIWKQEIGRVLVAVDDLD